MDENFFKIILGINKHIQLKSGWSLSKNSGKIMKRISFLSISLFSLFAPLTSSSVMAHGQSSKSDDYSFKCPDGKYKHWEKNK